MDTKSAWWSKFTAFLATYIDFPEEAFDRNEILTSDYVAEGVELLLDSNVFTSPEDLQATALKKMGLFLPVWLLNKYYSC